MNVGGICLTIKKQLSFKASAHKLGFNDILSKW